MRGRQRVAAGVSGEAWGDSGGCVAGVCERAEVVTKAGQALTDGKFSSQQRPGATVWRSRGPMRPAHSCSRCASLQAAIGEESRHGRAISACLAIQSHGGQPWAALSAPGAPQARLSPPAVHGRALQEPVAASEERVSTPPAQRPSPRRHCRRPPVAFAAGAAQRGGRLPGGMVMPIQCMHLQKSIACRAGAPGLAWAAGSPLRPMCSSPPCSSWRAAAAAVECGCLPAHCMLRLGVSALRSPAWHRLPMLLL